MAQASTIADDLVRPRLQKSSAVVTVVAEQASEVMAAADLLFVASGTATLQAAVVGTPMVLLYQAHSWLTYRLARLLIRVKWIGLVNLVAGRTVVTELIQHEATGASVYDEARRLLDDRAAYDEMKRSLQAVKASLGEPGASRRAAQVVLDACRA
jgi:lipid-A-disaccharide synthase